MPVAPQTPEDRCRDAIRRGLDDGYVGRPRLQSPWPGYQWLYDQGYQWGQADRERADGVIGKLLAVQEGMTA